MWLIVSLRVKDNLCACLMTNILTVAPREVMSSRRVLFLFGLELLDKWVCGSSQLSRTQLA